MTLSPRVVASAITTLVLLVLLNVWFFPGGGGLQDLQTSEGHGSLGHAAVYDLLSELGFSLERFDQRPDKLDDTAVVWFVAPYRQPRMMEPGPPVLEELRPWLERGGTAIVFGYKRFDWSMLELETQLQDSTALVVPSLLGAQSLRVDPGPEPIQLSAKRGEDAETPDEGELAPPPEIASPPAASAGSPASGELEPRSRFIVEVAVGQGRVVAVADGRFLANAKLDQEDHAALAVELVHAYGVPLFDERFHGLRPTQGFVELIGGGRLSLLLVTMLLLAAVAVFSRERWSARVSEQPAEIEATLETFVDALQHHYADTRDYPTIFRAYREGFLHRLRRQHRYAESARSEREFVLGLSRDPNLKGEQRRWLISGESPSGEAEMTQAVRALERFAKERG